MAKDKFNLNEWVGNKERRLLKEEIQNEEFSEFKTYDDIIGGLIIRANAMETFLQKKEPNLVYLAKALKTIINTLNEKIEGYKLTK